LLLPFSAAYGSLSTRLKHNDFRYFLILTFDLSLYFARYALLMVAFAFCCTHLDYANLWYGIASGASLLPMPSGPSLSLLPTTTVSRGTYCRGTAKRGTSAAFLLLVAAISAGGTHAVFLRRSLSPHAFNPSMVARDASVENSILRRNDGILQTVQHRRVLGGWAVPPLFSRRCVTYAPVRKTARTIHARFCHASRRTPTCSTASAPLAFAMDSGLLLLLPASDQNRRTNLGICRVVRWC